MNKRIFSVLALSVLLVGLFAGAALATTATANPNPVTITTGNTNTATVDVIYAVDSNIENTGTITFSLSKEGVINMPTTGEGGSVSGNGLNNAKTGVKAPNDAQQTITITLTRADGAQAGDSTVLTVTAHEASVQITVNVTEPQKIALSATPGTVNIGSSLSVPVTLSNYSGAVTWEVSGLDNYVDSAAINTSNGAVLTGTAKKVTPSGGVKFTIKATPTNTDDAELASDATEFTLVISGTAPTIYALSTDNTTSLATSGSINSANGGNGIVGGTALTKTNTPFKFLAWGTKDDSGLTITGTVKTAAGKSSPFSIESDAAEQSGDAGAYQGKIKAYVTGTAGLVTSETTYNVVLKATNGVRTTESDTFTFTVVPLPEVGDATVPITWGSAVNYTPAEKTNKNVTSWYIASNDAELPNPHTDYLTELPGGLTFNTSTGAITGTWDDPDSGDIALSSLTGSNKYIDKKIKVVGVNDTVSDDGIVTLRFTAIKPTIETSVSDVEATTDKLVTSQDVSGDATTDKTVKVVATGPGTITWTIGGKALGTAGVLPDGLSAKVSADPAEEAKSTLIIYGVTTMETFKEKALALQAANTVGNVKISPKFKVEPNNTLGVNGIIFSANSADIPSGDTFKIKDTLPTITVSAEPLPIKWTADNLPKGIKLKDNGNGTATLSGKFTAVTGTNSVYKLIATNKNFTSITASLSADLKVFEAPTIKTKKLADIIVGSAYTAKLEATGSNLSWDVTFSGDNAGYTYGYTPATGSATISLDKDAKGVYSIKGSIDRLPEGSVISVKVHVENSVGSEDKVLTITAKGVAPAFKTTSITSITATGQSRNIETSSGTLPIAMKAYIAPADAKKYFGTDGTKSIDLAPDEDGEAQAANVTGFIFTESIDETTDPEVNLGSGVLTFSGQGKAYKALPITFEASNSTKTVTKKLNVTVSGNDPSWYVASGDSDEYASAGTSLTLVATASVDLGTEEDTTARTGYRFIVSGDDPITVTVSPALGSAAKNGLIITSEDIYPDDDDDNRIVYRISGAPTKSKETKTAFTLTAKNPSTGKQSQLKVTVDAKQPPEISSKASALKKEVELGKKLSIKPAVKGSKGIKWVITDEESEDVSSTLNDTYGLKFNTSTGELSGTTKALTADEDDETVYASHDYYVQAGNSAGSSDIVVYTVGIKGEKPKFAVKQVEFDRAELDFEDEKNAILKTNIKTTEAATKAHVTYAPATDDEGDKLKELGFSTTIDSETKANYGIFTNDKDLIATKGTSVKITAKNFGSEVTGNIKVIVKDPKPEIENTKGDTSITASDSDKATEDFEFKLTDDTKATGDTSIKWALKTKPKKVTAKLTDNKDGTATVTITVPKNFKNVVAGDDEDLETSFGVTATNSNTKEVSEEYLVDITVSPVSTQDNSAKPEEAPADVAAKPEEAPAETEAEAEAEEKVAVYGKAGTVESLTEAQRSAIEEAGYIIVAVYDDVKVPEDNTYDFAFEVADGVKTGSEFAYFVFKAEEEANDDEKYAEFFDEDGAPVESVPESKKAEVSAWFSADSTYKSVVAVKADKAAADAVAESEIEEKAE